MSETTVKEDVTRNMQSTTRLNRIMGKEWNHDVRFDGLVACADGRWP